ncbi:MAG: hypothetical protein AAGI46_11860 [Planctomycetota bacterium]
MAKLEIEVSDEMIQVLARMGEKSGKSPAEALMALLDREIGVYVEDQKRFNDLIAEGDDSGPAIPVTDEYWAQEERHMEEQMDLMDKHRREHEEYMSRASRKRSEAKEAEAA